MKLLTLLILLLPAITHAANTDDHFPDGTPIDQWFYDCQTTKKEDLGKLFPIDQYGVLTNSTIIQTEAIQKVIDIAVQEGGTIVIPKGKFYSGALFFRQGVNLYLEKDAVLMGSDDINDFPILDTRIEGQSCKYFAALINAKGLNGFKICGEGTIDGNGLKYWKQFWLRRSWNPQCTNKDEQRPRLVFLDGCKNVEISGVTLQNSPFWTTHIYKCDHVKMLGLKILSPVEPVKAPSTDAIDIDACKYVLVKNCYMAVDDDAIALKGGKGPWADKDENNGSNEFIIIEDCKYGLCHGCITFGSEAIHCKNIILRRIQVGKATRLLWLKMRPDTPQIYEYITVEDITGTVNYFIFVKPWTQFFDLQGRTDMPMSYGRHVTMRNIDMECKSFFEVERSEQYRLADFNFTNIRLKAEKPDYDKSQIDNINLNNVVVNGIKIE